MEEALAVIAFRYLIAIVALAISLYTLALVVRSPRVNDDRLTDLYNEIQYVKADVGGMDEALSKHMKREAGTVRQQKTGQGVPGQQVLQASPAGRGNQEIDSLERTTMRDESDREYA